MPALNIARNNASSVKLNNDSVYCFGGSNQTGIIDSIEMFSFSLNEWKILEIKLPNPVSLCCSFRINDNKILIMGGLIKENSEKVNPYKCNQVLVFDTLVPNFYQSPSNLSEDCVSLYPVFYDDGKLYIINEIPYLFFPEVLMYDLRKNFSEILPEVAQAGTQIE